MFFTDVIDIERVSVDINGTVTSTLNQNIPARVTDNVKTIKNDQGEEIKPDFHILLDASTLIDYNDKVIIKKTAGKDFPVDAKKWKVLSLRNAHAFKPHHMELYV
jgi:hypothetical protein